VRELLDNALDAGAGEIGVYLRDGGVGSIRVVDDGWGMSREDLELCWLPHATSKISSDEDLERINTLGFRGEALSSIATCARLRITTRRKSDLTALHLAIDGGKLLGTAERQGGGGTVVEASDLFFAMPGRRRFLKQASAESQLCRTVFVDKALAFPAVTMRFTVDDELRLFLPATLAGKPADRASELGTALRDRVIAAYPGVAQSELMRVMEGSGEDFAAVIVAGGPSLYRKDRKYIHVFVNGRRISEFALVQAIEYGFAGWLPGGCFPVAFLFLTVDPSLVDFNIHPAKREARFRNLPAIHRFLVELIGRELRPLSVSYAGLTGKVRGDSPSPAEVRRPAEGFVAAERKVDFAAALKGLSAAEVSAAAGAATDSTALESVEIRYLGQAFSLFLVAVVGERLFLVDQHAAHERLLFERLLAQKAPSQRLLVPFAINASPEEGNRLAREQEALLKLGITLEQDAGRWLITSLPESFHGHEESLVEFLAGNHGDANLLERELYATLACHLAVKEGDSLEPAAALELIRGALALENARCPHGRPIWFELSREELYRLVGRII